MSARSPRRKACPSCHEEGDVASLSVLAELEGEVGRLRRTLGRVEGELAEAHARLSRHESLRPVMFEVGEVVVLPTWPTLQ